MVIEVNAPAKVNLHLAVLGLRQDGYHELISLFQTVSLYDRIEVEPSHRKGSIDIDGCPDVPFKKNTMRKAVVFFREMTNWECGVKIHVEKRIPMGSGLGGGSSDAASVILALDKLAPGKRPREALLSIGARIGSDVPFFLTGPAAIIQGRGEKTTPLIPRTDFSLVLWFPGFSISTERAYTWLKRGSAFAPRRDISALRSRYENQPVEKWRFSNDFTDTLVRRFPELDRMARIILEAGALTCAVTGSGSALFGLCSDRPSADKVAGRMSRHLTSPEVSVWVLNPLDTELKPVLE